MPACCRRMCGAIGTCLPALRSCSAPFAVQASAASASCARCHATRAAATTWRTARMRYAAPKAARCHRCWSSRCPSPGLARCRRRHLQRWAEEHGCTDGCPCWAFRAAIPCMPAPLPLRTLPAEQKIAALAAAGQRSSAQAGADHGLRSPAIAFNQPSHRRRCNASQPTAASRQRPFWRDAGHPGGPLASASAAHACLDPVRPAAALRGGPEPLALQAHVGGGGRHRLRHHLHLPGEPRQAPSTWSGDGI